MVSVGKSRKITLPPKSIGLFPPQQPANAIVVVQSDEPAQLAQFPEVHHVFGNDGQHVERTIMSSIGLDIGTKNIVLAYRSGKKANFLREVNGYYIYPNASKFVENMLSDQNIERADGTKRPIRWVKYDGRKGLYILGHDAEELAYAHNDTLMRPMAVGSIATDEDAMMVLASIVQGMLSTAEHEVGKFEKEVDLCYCTTAKAINSDRINVDYQRRVMDLIISGYPTEVKINQSSIRESHAIVLKESPDGTGIGLSFGAGTTTVSYCKFGVEVYSFCWAGAGDWIDIEVAKRHGYDPNTPGYKSLETPTTVCRAKESIDLTSALSTDDRLKMDIVLHYRLLIQNVLRGVAHGFKSNENQARIDRAIPIYVAGGTSSPPGFVELIEQQLAEERLPFEVGKVSRSANPLLAVAEGCLIAAENQV